MQSNVTYEEKVTKEKNDQDFEMKEDISGKRSEERGKNREKNGGVTGSRVKDKSGDLKDKRGMSFIDYILVCLLCLIVSIASVFVYDRFFVPKIAIVDLEAYVNSLRYLYVTGKITEKDLDKYMDVAIRSIQDRKNRYVIILGSVVVGRPKNVEYIALPEIPGAKDLRLEDLIKALQGNFTKPIQ
ncbi:MAG: hypothetical protein QXT86_12365 [Archaeoglobaceae archaeon]